MFKWLRRRFCKHKFMPYGYYDEPTGKGRYIRRHIWKCTKCGKEQINK